MKRKLPSLSGRSRSATAVSQKNRSDCWKNVAGFEKSMPCPGCHRVTLSVNQKNGWHASHIRARVNGGSTQAYNLYPLCDNCNGEMGDTNMFCHFYKDSGERSHTLDALIGAMHQVFRIEYADKYRALNGQFHALAQHYYTDIPLTHPVYKYFIEYDIRINTRAVMEAKREYDRLYEIAQLVNGKYSQIKGQKT